MRSRGLVVAIAVVLAIVAAAAVILYTNGVKKDAVTGGALRVVVVATQDIPANTNLNPLLEEGAFTELEGAGRRGRRRRGHEPEQLRGQTTTGADPGQRADPASRLSGGERSQGGRSASAPGNVGLDDGSTAPAA